MPVLMTETELEEAARLQYSRILWRNPQTRARLLYVWEHAQHPDHERFNEHRTLGERFLECADPSEYVQAVACDEWSLQTLTREIPVMIWTLWDESKEK